MNYLTAEQVLFIHHRIIEETGGSHGIRDIALLKSAIARPMVTFEKQDLYTDIFLEASSLMHSLIKNHPFIDGNKRTAITTASIFLQGNNYVIETSNKGLERFALEVACENIELQKIAQWFKDNSVSMKKEYIL